MIHKPTERVLYILTLLSSHPEGLSLTQITEQLHIPKSTISPILQEMVLQKFLTLQPTSNLYTLGIASYCIGAAYEHDKGLFPYLKSIMKDITNQLEEICQVGVLDGADVLYILKEDPPTPQTIKIISYIGKKIPAYCTALGKALLCEYSFEELQELYPGKLISQTPNTITDLHIFYQQLQTVKETHIAIESEEVTPQLCCFAVPITVANTQHYALSVSMPLFRATPEKIELAKKLLLQARASIQNFSSTNITLSVD